MDNRIVKYPDIHVQLTARDGNAFVIMGAVTSALRQHRVPAEEILNFEDQCWAAEDYDALLRVAMRWVRVS